MKNDSYTESTLPSDEELEQFTNYVCGNLSPAEEQAFDDRLADDDAFFDRMVPMLKVWYAPPPSVIEAGEQLKLRLAAEENRVVDTRRTASMWRRRAMIVQPRAQVREHVLVAFGGLREMKSLVRTLGLAAATVAFLYVARPPEHVRQDAPAPVVAHASPDSTHATPKQPPHTQIASATGATKRPPARKQLTVTPLLPVEPVVESPPLPSIPDVAVTPQAMMAVIDTIYARVSEAVADLLTLPSGREVFPTPGGSTTGPADRGSPGKLTPAGRAFHWPYWLSPWLWFRG